MSESPYPNKRTRYDDGGPRRSGSLSTNTHLSTPVGQTATYLIGVVDSRGNPTSLDSARTTPSRTTYFDLIYDALNANQNGLSSNGILEWLQANRQDAFRRYDKNKLRASIQSTLSAQSNKPKPTVWKYKVDGSEGSGYIWRLANTMPLMENATAKETSQVPPADDGGRDGSVKFQDVQASGSQVQNSQVAQVDSVDPIITQGHDNRKTGSTQTVATECAEVGGREGAQHELSDTSRNVRDIANLMTQTAMETTATTQTEPVSLVQHRTSLQDESQPGATTTRPGAPTSGTGIFQEHSDDHEEQLRLGRLVSRIRDKQKQYRRLKHGIEEERKALPDVKILEENVEQKAGRVADLTRLLEEARQSDKMARSDLEVTTTKITEIETAEREAEQIIADSEKLRSQLGIDYGLFANTGWNTQAPAQ
jgi:hypothetical protein